MRGGWKDILIQDLVDAGQAELKTGPFGTQLHASDYVEHGTPVINVRNIGFGEIRDGELEFINDETVNRLSGHLLRAGDIVFGRKGAVERHVFMRQQYAGWFQGSDCLRLRVSSTDVEPQFLSYCFQTDFHKQWMMNHCSHGATMTSLNQDIICRIPLRLPVITIQRKVIALVSAYDDLIEDNTRRVQILGKMAQALYREWFVNFRFPGHAKVNLVESPLGKAPSGWTLCELKDVCAGGIGIQTGPFGSQLHQADYTDDGVPVVMPKDLIGFRISTTSVARVPDAIAERLARHKLELGDIVYGRRGDIGRRAFVTTRQVGWLCGTGCLRLRPDVSTINGWFLFNFLGQDTVASLIAGRAHGATMPNLNTRLLASVPVVIPPRQIQDAFQQITEPMSLSTETLTVKNINLRRTRDLLLPKLMSGALDVSKLDIANP